MIGKALIALNGDHLSGMAADIQVADTSPRQLAEMAEKYNVL